MGMMRTITLSLPMTFTASLCGILLSLPLTVNATYVLDETSRRLAYCGDVFAYAANWFLIQNNEGAAKVMLSQQARATVTLFTMHYESGKVSGERVAAFRNEGRRAKPFLDANPSKLTETVDACVATTNKFAAIQSRRKIKMWGKDFYEIVEEMAMKSRVALGIR